MLLYTYWRSSSAYRVRIGLGLKGLSYEPSFVHMVRGGGEQHRPEFRSKNPRGQIPVLEIPQENGAPPVELIQSLAILEYLEEQYPTPALLPKDPFARARVREYAHLICSGLQPFHNTGTTNYLKAHAPDLDQQSFVAHFVGAGLAALEARAGDSAGRFLVGDDVSLADVMLVPQLYAARRFSVPLEAYPTLLRVDAECAKVDAFAAAHPDRQPDRE
ncbi:MAG: maleylacetoacetate isomerase [Myxococcales bacterium]|jgi:maleylpyruvate isomerase